MTVFCRVVELQSFSAAARQLGMSPAMVSRHIAALEKQLGIRLLDRSTRLVQVSEAGQDYYQRCLVILEQVEALEQDTQLAGQQPRGLLKISAPMDFGQLYLLPAIRSFLCSCPDIRMEVHYEDRQVRLLDEHLDVLIRIAHLEDSSLVARPLAQTQICCYASPDYLALHGEPQHPSDLINHTTLRYLYNSEQESWTFQDQESQTIQVPLNWRMTTNNGRSLAEAASHGLGIIRNPEFLVADYVRNGQLIEILKPFRSEPLDISAVYPHQRFRPAKTAAFVDFLMDYFKEKPIGETFGPTQA